jgi:hypothetical protein
MARIGLFHPIEEIVEQSASAKTIDQVSFQMIGSRHMTIDFRS